MDRRAGYTAHPLWRRGSGYFSFWDAFPDTRTLHSVLFSYAGRGRYQTPIRCWRLSRCASDPEMYDCVVPVWSGLIYRNYSRLRKFTAASYQIFQLFPNLFYQKKIPEKNRAGSLLRWEVGHGVHPFFRSRADGSVALDGGILLNTAKKKSVFAVCDTEMEYARNFMEYLNQKRNIPFEVHAFSSAEMFLEFAKNNETEILLISDKAMKEEIRRYPIRQIIILSEGVHSPVLDQYPAVYKYQSSEKVIREVMACYGVENGVDTSPALLPKKEMRIIGIYSPVGRTQKTSFALTMGQILAKERAVLYLNMESYSGFERLLECSYDRGMSDILYYARQENQGIIYKLGGMVQSMQNLDYLPPAASPMDIQTAKYEEWKWLFQEIEKNSSYEVLILDLGDGVADLYQILDFCNEIYVPIRNDVISAAKMEQFENLLRRWDCQSVLDKMRKIHVPFHTANRTGKAYFEELVWSELGDYVRQILRDGRRGEET